MALLFHKRWIDKAEAEAEPCPRCSQQSVIQSLSQLQGGFYYAETRMSIVAQGNDLGVTW